MHKADVLHAISPIWMKLSQFKGSTPKIKMTNWFIVCIFMVGDRISGRLRQFYFLQKTRITKMKNALKIKIFICILYSKLKKRKPFFNASRHYGNLRKVPPFSHEKRDIFRICLRYKVKQLSWVIFISHGSQKSWKETFLEFFRLFAFFFKAKKVEFFPPSLFGMFWRTVVK